MPLDLLPSSFIAAWREMLYGAGGAVTASFRPTVMYSSSFADDVELHAMLQPLIPSPKVAEDSYLIKSYLKASRVVSRTCAPLAEKSENARLI